MGSYVADINKSKRPKITLYYQSFPYETNQIQNYFDQQKWSSYWRFERLSNGSFTLDQRIDFGTKGIYGCITEDGKYLITWDDKSKEIQIRTPQK